MPTFRDIRRQMRDSVHAHMNVRAYYIAPAAGPVDVEVRVHDTVQKLGDMKGTSLSYSERYEHVPTIILSKSQVAAPARLAVISISPGEAYRIDTVLPADGDYITVEVSRMRTAETVGLPVPGDYDAP